MSFKPLKLFCLAVLTFGLVGVPLWQGFSSAQAQPPDAAYPVPILPRTANAVMARDGMAAQTRDLTLEQMMGYGSSRNQVKSAAIPEETYLPDDNLPEEAKKLIADQKAREDELYKELENRLRDQRKELHARLRKLQDSYTKMGDLDRAVALRDQVRRLDLSITQAKPDPGQLTTYRGQVGKSFVFAVVGRRGSSIWGDDGVYTDDSDIGTAAVHAGFLRPGQRGLVKVTILPGKRSYPGSTRHGVTSTPFDSFPGSYRLERADTDVRERGDQGDE